MTTVMRAKTTKIIPYARMDRTKNPVRKTIFAPKNSGFTLLEILIVLAIISMVTAIGLPSIQRITGQRLASTTRRFVGLLKSVRNDAVLLNSIYRITVNLDENTYWIEKQNKRGLISDNEETNVDEQGNYSSPNFSFADKYTKKPTQLPGGIVFDGIYKEREGILSKGIAYIHFFPNGFNEASVIYINNEGSEDIPYALEIRPASGSIEIFREAFNEQ